MTTKKSIPKTKVKNTFNLKETFTQHRRLIIWVVCLILLAVLLWFVFRKVKTYQSENKAERELLLRQRAQAEQALITRDSLARAKEDSLIMEILGIRERVEYRIIERKIYVERFIDTASIRTKHKYIDSLLGTR